MENENLTINEVESKIILLRNQQVILDCDVAQLYGVETKRINEAVSNNPEKFPEGYVLYIDNQEFNYLRSKISTTNFSKTRTLPKAFTEKGLYELNLAMFKLKPIFPSTLPSQSSLWQCQ